MLVPEGGIMAQPKATSRDTPAEYLALERAAETKSDYLDGEIFAMAGASRRHNLITGSVVTRQTQQLESRPCEVYPSDMRVRVPATDLYTYPDVTVVCEEPQFEDAELDVLLNPTLLVEVLSPSTADYDRGFKFDSYRTINSLREVLFIAQNRVHVVHYVRQADDTWILAETRNPEESLSLASIGARLSLSEVYAKVQLDDAPGPTRIS
jgi:Uma2 family endonuclease